MQLNASLQQIEIIRFEVGTERPTIIKSSTHEPLIMVICKEQ